LHHKRPPTRKIEEPCGKLQAMFCLTAVFRSDRAVQQEEKSNDSELITGNSRHGMFIFEPLLGLP
jgi:hypothetical protein